MHVDRENKSAKFWLEPVVSLAVNYGYSRDELRRIERLLEAHLDVIQERGMPSAVVTVTRPKITRVRVTEDTLTVDLEDGRTISVPLSWYPRLVHATPEERQHFQIAGAGYGIHWPDLDEDIGVEGLLFGKRSMESPASLARWLARRSQAKPSA